MDADEHDHVDVDDHDHVDEHEHVDVDEHEHVDVDVDVDDHDHGAGIMSLMNIGLIAGEYPPMQGGLGDFTRELARAIAIGGAHVPHVLALITPNAPTHEVIDGVQVHRTVRRWGWHTWRELQAWVHEHQIDVLNLQYQAAAYQMHGAINLLPLMWAKMTQSVPLVVTFHDLRVPYLFPKAGALRWQVVLQMARSAAASIVTNAEDEATLAAHGIAKLARIPIGSNITPTRLDAFDAPAWRQAHHIPHDPALIGYFGFMNESKGGETLIRALAALRQHGLNVAVLQIGGQTGASDPTNIAYLQRLSQLARELKVQTHIHATGFLDDRAVSEAFAACACLALPYRDGVSFRRGTLMAALVHGCAIVTTAPKVAMPEVIHGVNLWLAPPDAPEPLADGIRRVLQEADLRQRLQQGALALGARFGWDRIAAETVALLGDITQRRKGGETQRH